MTSRLKFWLGGLLLFFLVCIAAVAVFLQTSLARQWLRNELISQIQSRTGTRVEIGALRLNVWRLRTEIENLTAHGIEAADAPPLFHADRVDVGVHIVSFFRRQIALDYLTVEHPQVAVRIDRNGRSNVPSPNHPPGSRNWRQNLFSLRIGQLELRDGSVDFNDRRVPLDLRGQNLEFDLRYAAPPAAAESYVGSLNWQQVEFAEKRDLPFRFDLATKFTLHPNSFELDNLVCKLPHSEFDLRAELASFDHPDWALHYRGQLSLADVRKIFRAPTTPDAIADFSGQARYSSGAWAASGHYRGHDIRMPYQWFHASGIETSGDYRIADNVLSVPNLQVRALGGSVEGTLAMDFRGLKFKTQTRLRGASLAAALKAVNNESLPVNPLHWDAALDVDSVNTWERNFKNFRTAGQTRWSPPPTLAPGLIPASAKIDYDYSSLRGAVTLSNGEISTPKMQLNMDGFLGAVDSALEVKFRADDLGQWDDFISAIRGPDASPRRITGQVEWNGRILGPLVGPTFSGHMHAQNARYDTLYWNEIAGDMEYSPDDFRLTRTTIRRGSATSDLDLSLKFDSDWSFVASSPWSLTAHMTRAPSDDLQAVFDTHYPVKGLFSGTVHGSGTRADPAIESDFTFDDIQAGRFRFDRLAGQLRADSGEISLARAELHKGSQLVSGNILYRFPTKEANFDISGSGVSLENIPEIQTAGLPIAGKLDFHMRGSGPLRSPIGEASLKIVDLKLGSEMQGNFTGDLSSDGQRSRLILASELAHGKLTGDVSLGLVDKSVSGRLTVEQFDLDPVIAAGLHLRQLTGHSSADGTFAISGNARDLDSIGVSADITRISFDYELVQLTNDKDIQVDYRRNEVRMARLIFTGRIPTFQFEWFGALRSRPPPPFHSDRRRKSSVGQRNITRPEARAAPKPTCRLKGPCRARASPAGPAFATQPPITAISPLASAI